MSNWNTLKKVGRRKAGTWGRTHGPTRGNSKRAANKAIRKTPMTEAEYGWRCESMGEHS